MKAQGDRDAGDSPSQGSGKALASQKSPSLIQAVAGDMKRGFLLLALSLGGVGAATAIMGHLTRSTGLLVVASSLGAIVLVSSTLYVFLKLWPEEEIRTPSSSAAPAETPLRRQAMVSAVRAEGPPRMRFMMALREIARKQDSFRISQEGAERFAKTIRYLLRSSR